MFYSFIEIYKELHFKLFLFLYSSVYCFGQVDSNQKIKIEMEIDSLINISIYEKAFPGAQIYFKLDDKIIINKSYGFHTYDSLIAVENDHIYDLASLTKVFASTLAIMKISEDYKINLNDPISNYIKDLKRSNKKNTTFFEALSHTSGWIPYISHQNFIKRKNEKLKTSVIRNEKTNRFNLMVSENLFLNKNYYKKLFKRIRKSKVENVGSYLYSGLFFFYVPEIIKKITGENFEDYLNDTFFKSIENNSIMFSPLEKVNKKMIVPTEFDSIFRKLLIHGTVHDEAASLMGGISGNAGLFGNASGIGKLLDIIDPQNDNSVLNDSTLSKFTSYAYPNSSIRRGLGFDKPYQFSNQGNYPNTNFSKNSFGHTGFTGTFFWVDPLKKIKIVFLTNRVYPSRENEKLFDNEIRSKLIDILLTTSKSIRNE